MTCTAGTTTFRIESEGTTLKTADSTNVDVCTATQILDRLHREFTEKYEPVPTGSASVTVGKTQISAGLNVNPTFHLRNQPPVTSSDPINRFYKIFTEKTDSDPEYRSVVSAIMKGVNEPGATGSSSYKTEPAKQSDFTSNPAGFKGIYGLINVNELLEKKIADTVVKFSGSSITTNAISDTDRYEMRNGIKTTFEEIAHRENQIYREKFLNIILIVFGIFLVSTQLVKKYFSFGSFGFGGGSLFSGFGLGTNSGLFSRFGGLGLGRSGRSRLGSSLFTNNPYTLSNR